MNTKKIALIPAYEPDRKLIALLKDLSQTEMDIIVVNDGSDTKYLPIFEEAGKYAKVLNHVENFGKGRALKTGMREILTSYEGNYIVVTLDADGQHTAKDAEKVAICSMQNPNALILGSRKLSGDIPLRSKFGNTVTRFVYFMAAKTKVHDTQTGLRAFTNRNIQKLLHIRGERYEYEMNVLLEAPRLGIEIKESEIQTIYLDNNSSSHFDSVKDSFRIYKEILKFSASSFMSFLLDYGLFSLLTLLTGQPLPSNIAARCVSGGFNFMVNKKYVFRSGVNTKKAAMKYFALALLLLIGNTAFLSFLTKGLMINVFLAKILTEITFFFISLSVQKHLVFSDDDSKKKKFVAKALNIGLTSLLLGFTTYIGLDTFVITKVYATAYTPSTALSVQNASGTTASADSTASTGTTASAEATASADTLATSVDTTGIQAVSTDTTYKDANMEITLSTHYENNSYIYVADIKLSSAEYLKTALAQNLYGKNITATTSATAKANNAILAINGDYYGTQESGYVIRNGVLYHSTAKANKEDLVIYADGSFEIINESEITAQELMDKGAVQVLSFGPGLLINNQIEVTTEDEVGKAMASNPRTAIGQYDDLHYVFVVSDGRTNESVGLSLYQLAEFMQKLGVNTAYNLDGGGSSTMYFNGNVVNNPTTRGNTIKERAVSDIVYIGY